MGGHLGYLNHLWLIANDVGEILKILGQLRVPRTLSLMKTANICQGFRMVIMRQRVVPCVMLCPVVAITKAAIWRDAQGVGRG
jgi:hypothetical protein